MSNSIADKAVSFQEEDAEDISQVMAGVSPVVECNFPFDAPQHIFWEQQRQYNSLKDKMQMRWHPLVVHFALNLKYLFGTTYQAIHQSDIIRSLPNGHSWITPIGARCTLAYKWNLPRGFVYCCKMCHVVTTIALSPLMR